MKWHSSPLFIKELRYLCKTNIFQCGFSVIWPCERKGPNLTISIPFSLYDVRRSKWVDFVNRVLGLQVTYIYGALFIECCSPNSHQRDNLNNKIYFIHSEFFFRNFHIRIRQRKLHWRQRQSNSDSLEWNTSDNYVH